MKAKVSLHFSWDYALLCEKIDFHTFLGHPSEALLSFNRDSSTGWVISFGIGGVQTENWSKHIKNSVLNWPIDFFSAENAFEEFKSHFLFSLWTGKIRAINPILSENELKLFFEKIWTIPHYLDKKEIGFLEINPLVIDSNKQLIALDGVGKNTATPFFNKIQTDFFKNQLISFFYPKTIGLIGASEKPGSIGRTILENILDSKITKNNVKIISHKHEKILGISCIKTIEELKNNPIDILIVAIPAPQVIELIEQLCTQKGGAHIVYIVSGGIGDSADHSFFGQKLNDLLLKNRINHEWTPLVLGPNGLGFIHSQLQLSTLFIPPEKLSLNWNSSAQTALISQSGAFLITRLSKNSKLSIKYGISIGNQIDVKIHDMLSFLAEDPTLNTFAIYAEGFNTGEINQLSQAIQKAKQYRKSVLFYKGGQTEIGQKAAAGHTGAMANDFALLKKTLKQSGALFCSTLSQFNAALQWLSCYPEQSHWKGLISIIANAGYEAVAFSDQIDLFKTEFNFSPYSLSLEEETRLAQCLENLKMNHLVSSKLPLDLTPMANETVWIECLKTILNTKTQFIVLGLVPLTPMLNSNDKNKIESFAQTIRHLANEYKKPIGLTIDCGTDYDEYKIIFLNQNLPVFDSIDLIWF